MTSSIKIPAVVSILGKAIELKARLNNGDEVLYAWPTRKNKSGRPAYLASNARGTALYIIPIIHLKKSRKTAALKNVDSKDIAKAGKLYENFTDFEMDVPIVLAMPKSPLKRGGRAVHIVYESDKWTGKDTDYIHTFKQEPIVHLGGGVKNPKIIALTGGRIRVQPRGIIG